MNIVFTKLIEKYMALIIFVVSALALFMPHNFLWIKLSYINYLLMIVMFGMGLTLNKNDFKILFTNPKNILIGCAAQYLIMPLLAFLLCKLFGLNEALTIGMILVGACPGGTASNIITYLSKGDIAYSIGMTSVNTLIAPFITPFIVYLILRTTVEIDILSMFFSIIYVIIIPIIAGIVSNKFFKNIVKKLIKIFPSISVIAISFIVISVVAHNANQILDIGIMILLAIILHNLLGYLSGYMIGKILKLDDKKIKALTIEIGMQNAGLATSLAATSFPTFALATLPGALFSIWHNISGAILANIFSKNKK